MERWRGFSSSVLPAVAAALTADQARLGLKFVSVGEQMRGWVAPAAFVFLGPAGVRENTKSGRVGTADYRIPIVVAVAVKDALKSVDADAIALAESCMDTIEAACPLPDVRDVRFQGIRVEKANDAVGAYTTVAYLEFDAFKVHDDGTHW